MPRRLFRGNFVLLLWQRKKNKAEHPVKTYSFRCKKSIHALFGKYTICNQISLPEWMSDVFLFKVHVSRIYEEKRRVQRENKWLNLLRSWCISERCIWCHENHFHSLSKKLFGGGTSTMVLGRGKNLIGREALLPGKLFCVRKVFTNVICRKTCQTVRTLS